LQKILLITYEYPTYTPFGGIAFYYQKVAQILSETNFDVTVVTAKLEESDIEVLNVNSNLKEVYISCKEIGEFECKGLIWILDQNIKYEVIEIPEYGALLNNAISKGTLQNITKQLVIRVHGTTILASIYNKKTQFPKFLVWLYNRFFLRKYNLKLLKYLNSDMYRLAKSNQKEFKVINNSNIITAPSYKMAKFIDTYWLEKGSTVVFPNPGQFVIEEYEKTISNKSELKVAYVNRLQYLKGFDLFLQLSKEFNGTSNIHFSAFGSYDQLNIDSSISEILKTLELKGFVNANELVTVYKEYDIIIVPSRFESFSNVVLEAMGYGCIILLSDNIGMSEKIKHGVNGFVFESGKSNSLKSVFQQIINKENNELVGVSKAAYDTALELSKNSKLIEFYNLVIDKQ
jgi:glycosyltransferase involved in cell wall biosynthesis